MYYISKVYTWNEMYSVFSRLIENLTTREFKWSENSFAKVFEHYINYLEQAQ